MKRFKILLLIIICMLLMPVLTGCFKLGIDIGIDDRFTAHLTYIIELDMNDIDSEYHDIISISLNNLGWYYQEDLGFTVGIRNDEDITVLTMRRSTDNNNFKEAFLSLQNMLTDENMTPFSITRMDIISHTRADNYIISCTTDFAYVINNSGSGDLPPDLEEAFLNGVAASSGTVTLKLPVSEIAEASHDIKESHNYAEMTVPVSFDEQTGFTFKGTVIYSPEGLQTGAFNEIINQLINKQFIVKAIYISFVGLLLIILVISLLRVRKHNKVNAFDDE